MGFKGLSRFLVVGEKQIFGEIQETLRIANEANQVMVRMVKEFNLDTLAAENQNISKLEKEADGVTFRIRRDIIDGAVNPSVLDNLLTCVDLADSLVDNFRYLARELNRIAHVDPDKTSDRIPSLDSAFLDMLGLGTHAFA